MKYTIFGLQQEKLIENDLSIEDALIIERMIWLSGVFTEIIIDGKSYKWISYSKIKGEVPIVAKNDSKLKRIMHGLESKKIIERYYKKANNQTKVYFHFTEKIKELTGQKSTVTSNRPEMTGQVTGQNCSDTNRPEMTDETSGIYTSGIDTSGIGAKRKPREKFITPSLNDVLQYINENGITIDGNAFFHFYEARGWCFNNGRQMKSWQSAAHYWSRNKFSKEVKKPYDVKARLAELEEEDRKYGIAKS